MLSVRWRPSGGRGEYEYIVKGLSVLGKVAVVEVPVLGTTLPTDVSFQVKDGKPRLRRASPNDRTLLNIPPLAAAIAGLPPPKREDQSNAIIFPLSEKSYVVDEVLFEVWDHGGEKLVLKPRLIKVRNSDVYIDVEERIQYLLSHAGDQQIDAWAMLLQAGVNQTATLSLAASEVHSKFPYTEAHGADDLEIELYSDESFGGVDTYVGNEGAIKLRVHRSRERDKRIVKVAKTRFELIYGFLFCECCGFNFEEAYGQLGKGFAEAHHRTPLSQMTQAARTRVEDLAMLCSNCHRMIHRSADCSLEHVQSLLIASKMIWSPANLALIESIESTGEMSHQTRRKRLPR